MFSAVCFRMDVFGLLVVFSLVFFLPFWKGNNIGVAVWCSRSRSRRRLVFFLRRAIVALLVALLVVVVVVVVVFHSVPLKAHFCLQMLRRSGLTPQSVHGFVHRRLDFCAQISALSQTRRRATNTIDVSLFFLHHRSWVCVREKKNWGTNL